MTEVIDQDVMEYIVIFHNYYLIYVIYLFIHKFFRADIEDGRNKKWMNYNGKKISENGVKMELGWTNHMVRGGGTSVGSDSSQWT